MRRTFALLFISLCVFRSLFGQQARDAPLPPTVTRDTLPPSAILQDGLAALDRVRSNMGNWSDIELAAFATTAAKANADCIRIEQAAHEGDEELALARLCALGRNWDGVYSAARWYTRRSAAPEQSAHLLTGFALLLQADLNMQAIERAVTELAEMQERLAYSADMDSIFTYAIEATEVNRSEYGLRAAQLRQPALLAAISGLDSTLSPGIAEAEAWHTLALLHAASQTADEAIEKAKLVDAIAHHATNLSTADQYLAQQGRARYEWLGKTLPTFATERSTYAATARHTTPAAKAVLLIVAASSAADVATLSLAVDSLRARLAPGTQARLVLIGSPVAKKDPREPVIHGDFTHEPLLATLGYDSGPLFVTLDASGSVTWLSMGTPAWLNPQQQAETLLQRTLDLPSDHQALPASPQ